MHDIKFNVRPEDALDGADADGAGALPKCPIPIQKETPTGLVDTICQNDVDKDQAGMCR